MRMLKKFIKIKNSEYSTISETVKLKGTINNPSMFLEVKGSIKGTVRVKTLIINETGSISGSVEAELLMINGKFDGKASISEITIGPKGIVKGDVEFSNNFINEDGAKIDAQIRKKIKLKAS